MAFTYSSSDTVTPQQNEQTIVPPRFLAIPTLTGLVTADVYR